MTYLEMARELRPDLSERLTMYCPSSFDLEHDNIDCPPKNGDRMSCLECWNREIPNTQNKTEEETKL